MKNKELQEKLESIINQIRQLDNIESPTYIAFKLLNANNELELAVKFLKLNWLWVIKLSHLKNFTLGKLSQRLNSDSDGNTRV